MSPEKLASLQQSLRDALINDGISAALAALKKALPDGAEKFNLVFQVEARLNSVNKDRIRGVLSQEQLDLAYNRLNADVLDMIAHLGPEDFAPPAPGPSAAPNKTGSVLYQIPRSMKLDAEKEYRCIVRLAFSDEDIVENIDLSKDTVLKPVRVSEVMEVDLRDPNGTPAFSIRRINEVEQFLEDNSYTEWIFLVKPLRAGELPLMLVVAVKEYIRDRPVKREIVLEELVQVAAEPAEEEEEVIPVFHSAGYSFSYTSQEAGGRALSLLALGFLKILGNNAAAIGASLALGAGAVATAYYMDWIPPIFRQKPPIEIPVDTSLLDEDAYKPEPDSVWNDSLGKFEQPVQSSAPKPPGDVLVLEPGGNEEGDGAIEPPQTLSAPVKIPVVDTIHFPNDEPLTQEDIDEVVKDRKSGFIMVRVEGGSLAPGSHYGSDACSSNSVGIKTFYIGKYEITQADWVEIMGANPAFKRGCSQCPVERVSWEEIQTFLQKASEAHGRKYRLPYEVEWEFAARGGLAGQGFRYAGSDKPAEVAWYNTVKEYTHRIGRKKANELGIHDMSGNVREWCAGPFPPYLTSCKAGPSDKRILRGGSWVNTKSRIELTHRVEKNANFKDEQSGLRLVLEP
jgi:formylglycine-generating enzyme required for sulfatase activity